MSTSTVRIFVSSPKLGLEPERLAVKAALERMRGAEFVGMELFGSRDEDAQTASLEEVDGSQLYIGIIGGRYGSGITHAEYGRARERGLKCLFYIQNDEAIRLCDDDPAAAKSLAGWIAAITDSYRGHLVTHFSNADELATSVAADVHNWLYKRLAGETTAAASAGAMEHLRALLSQTRNARALREALLSAGIAAGDDLLDSLAALFPAALRQFLGGIDELPTDYAARIEGFLGEYLGTPESPVPFGGRASVFHDLDSWLDDAGAPPYLLVAAEAGRGKSAALVRWIRRHLGDPKTEIVFVPISIRFRTNLSNVFFPALAAKLARAHGETVPTEVNLPAEVWRGIVAEYLRQPLPGGRSLVVVIDGLDEAAGWEAGPDLFPGTPPPGVRVIASARLTADAPSAAAWLKQLGWNERTAKALPLEFLTLDGVRDVVSGTGFPVAELSRDVDVIQQLFRLSEGDPLLIRLYVDQLRKQGDQAARLRPEDLEKIDPGLDGFFADWWRYQRKLWDEEGDAPLKERSVQAVLDLLSVAFGPLRREDILALATPDSELTKWTLDDALDPIRRFVIEEQSGLVFSHPRFGQFLGKDLPKANRRALDERFAAWSRSVREAMSNGALDPVDAPPYVVLYTGAHLERVNAGVADLCALLTPEWRTACEAVEGALTGFATDTGRAWRAARRENERLIAAGQPPHEIGTEALCFLVRTRIRALAQSIPAPIAGRLVQEEIWQPKQGIAYARNMDPSLAKVQMLAEMSRHCDAKTGGELLDEARLLVDGWNDAKERGEAFIALIAAGGSDELLTDLLKLPLGQYDGIWTDAAKTLIASGRAADVSRVSAAGKYIKAKDALHSMIELGQFDEAATVWPLLVHMLDSFSAPTLSFRLALHGRFVPDHRGVDPDPRISRIAERIRNGLPLDLDRNDLPWLVELFTVWDLTPDLAEIACAAAAAMDDDLRTVLLRDVPSRLYVDDYVLRRVALLQPPEEARKQLREILRTESSYTAGDWIMEAAPLMHGDLIAESLKRMLQGSSDVLDFGMSGVLELFLRHAPAAVQDALGKLNPGRAALKVLSVAARLDTEHRQELVRRLFEIYRESEPWERRGADLAALVPFLDRSMILAAVDVFTRFNDRTWSDTAMFVFDASAPPSAPLIEAWRSSAQQLEPVVAAAVVPQHAGAALRTLLTATHPRNPTFILNATWAADLLLPAAEARAFHRDVWTRVGASPVAYVERLPNVMKLPDPEWTAGWVERIPRPAERGKALKAEIGRALLLPASERREAVRAIEADYSIAQLVGQDLEHIAGDLSGELVSALLARALSDDGEVNRRLIAAIAPRLSQDEIHRVIEHVASLSVSVRTATMTALLPVLEDARRKEAIRWLLSPEVIAESEILDLAGRPLSADLRAEIIEAVQALDPVQTARALAGEPDDLVVGVIIAGRILSLQPAVARKLATIVFDVSWQASSPNEAWCGLYSLRPLLLQSGDAHLFPDILQAIRRATAIFP